MENKFIQSKAIEAYEGNLTVLASETNMDDVVRVLRKCQGNIYIIPESIWTFVEGEEENEI